VVFPVFGNLIGHGNRADGMITSSVTCVHTAASRVSAEHTAEVVQIHSI